MRAVQAMAALALLAATPAHAGEIFGGVLAHDIDSRLTRGGFEGGVDFQVGWRGAPLRGLRAVGSPSAYVFGSFHSGGDTHFAAAGLSWRIGDRLFLRPALGIAVHTRGSGVRDGLRTDLGSRFVFEPELGVGYQVSERFSVEATWVHLSHAQLLSRQNPGMDSVGLRLNYRLR